MIELLAGMRLNERLSPMSPSETAIELVLRIKGKYRHGDSADEADAALIDAALSHARTEVIRFAEGGRFLHDDAPPAQFAREFAKAAREHFRCD